jgi:predicted RNase H-like HicB family nuclease
MAGIDGSLHGPHFCQRALSCRTPLWISQIAGLLGVVVALHLERYAMKLPKSSQRRMRPRVIRIIGQIAWKVSRNPKTGVYIGECDSLNVTAQGQTRSELLEMIDDILQTLLTDMATEGRLQQVARRHGWKIEGELPKRGARQVPALKFDLPFVVPDVIAPNVAAA